MRSLGVLDAAARVAIRTARAAGLDVRKTAHFPAGARAYWRDLRRYRKALRILVPGHSMQLYPVLGDARAVAGQAQGHYFHQDLWAAKKVIARRPSRHVDVGSRIDGFIGHLLASGLVVTSVDVRSGAESVDGLEFVRADATHLAEFSDDSIESMSCLHAVEHFGLGRYGDALDPEGSERACRVFHRKLCSGGNLLISAPIGRPRTEFNAHRVFDPMHLPGVLDGMELREFAAVDDGGFFRQGVEPSDFADARFALGLYEFEKSVRRETQT